MNFALSLLFLTGIPILAGFAVIGFRPYIGANMKLMLSFSGSFLLSICLIHLLPELFEKTEKIGFFILIGFFIQVLLDFFSEGIEHGHVHSSKQSTFPYLIFISLCIHSFIEGFPLTDHLHQKAALSLNSAMFTGVLLHKIPIAIVLMTLLLDRGIKPLQRFLAILIFALTAPAGVLLVYLSGSFNNGVEMHYLSAIAVGIFLHISTVILFESSHNHQFNGIKFITIMLGVIVAILAFGTH